MGYAVICALFVFLLFFINLTKIDPSSGSICMVKKRKLLQMKRTSLLLEALVNALTLREFAEKGNLKPLMPLIASKLSKALSAT